MLAKSPTEDLPEDRGKMLVFLSVLLVLSASVRAGFPATEYMYSLNRDALLNAEERFENREGRLTWVRAFNTIH